MITIITCSFGKKSSDKNPGNNGFEPVEFNPMNNDFRSVEFNPVEDSLNTSGFFGGNENSDFKPVEDDKNFKPWVQGYESKGNDFSAATDPRGFWGNSEDSLSELDKAFIFAPEDKKLKKTKSKSKSKELIESRSKNRSKSKPKETIPEYARPSSMNPKHTSKEYHRYNEFMQKNLKEGNKFLPLPEVEEDPNSFLNDSQEPMDEAFCIPVADNNDSLNISDLYDFNPKKPKSNFIKDSKANITYGHNKSSVNNPFKPLESKPFEYSRFSSIESNVLPDTRVHKNDFFYNILSQFQLILGKYNNQCAGVLGDCLLFVKDNIKISSVNEGNLEKQIDIYLNTVKGIVSKVLFAYVEDSKVYGNVNDCWIVLVREFHGTIVSQLELCKPENLNNWDLGDLHNYVIVDFGKVQDIKIIKKSDYSKESAISECSEFLKSSKRNINYKVNNKSNASKLDNKKNEHRAEESKNLIDGNSHIVSSITKVLWPSYKNFIIKLIESDKLQLTNEILRKHKIKFNSDLSEFNYSLMAKLLELNKIIQIFDKLITSKSDDIFKEMMKIENRNTLTIKDKIDNAFSSIETVWWGFLNKLKIQGVIDFDEILWIKLRKLFADKFGSSKFEWNEIYKLDMSGEFASITLDSLLSVEFEELSYGKTIKYKDPQKAFDLIVEFSECKLRIEEFDNALMASELNKKLPCSNLSSGHESLSNSGFSIEKFDCNYPKDSNDGNSKFSNFGEFNRNSDLIPTVSKDKKPTDEPQWLQDMKYGIPQDDPRRLNGRIEDVNIGFRQRNEPINMCQPEGSKAYNTHDKSTFGPSVPVEPEVPRYISNSGFDICREDFLEICEKNNIESINGSCDIFARSISNKAERIKWLGDELMHWHKKFDELYEKSIEVYLIYDGKLRKYVLNRNSVLMNDDEMKKYVNEICKYEENLNNLISKNFVNLFTNYLKELMKFTIDKRVNQLYGPKFVGNAQKPKDMNNKFTNGMQELSKSVINNAKILHNELIVKLGLNSLNYKNI